LYIFEIIQLIRYVELDACLYLRLSLALNGRLSLTS